MKSDVLADVYRLGVYEVEDAIGKISVGADLL